MINKISILLTLLLPFTSVGKATATPVLEWGKQFGTSQSDRGEALATDSAGNVYLAGMTQGNLAATNAGSNDIFLAKYDSLGKELWIRQFDGEDNDFALDIAVDPTGNIFVAGTSVNVQNPAEDGFLSKYDPFGVHQWTHSYDADDSNDAGTAVAIDSDGYAYLAGRTTGDLGGPQQGAGDVYLTKLSPAGNVQWTRQTGGSDIESPTGVVIDPAGNIVVSYNAHDPSEDQHNANYDPVLVKYDSAGGLLWEKRYFSSLGDQATDVTTDDLGNIYTSGWIDLHLPGESNFGKHDALATKHDPDGNILWTRQLVVDDHDESTAAVAVDSSGNVYIQGNTRDGLLGDESFGGTDAWFAKYNSSGGLQWIEQYGTADGDNRGDLTLDELGGIYVTGRTTGNLIGSGAGMNDVYLLKYSEVPEPSTWLLLVIGSTLIGYPRRFRAWLVPYFSRTNGLRTSALLVKARRVR